VAWGRWAVAEPKHWTAAEWQHIEHIAHMHRLARTSAQKGGPNRHQRNANAYARELRAYAGLAIARGVGIPQTRQEKNDA
jgi:hypothetical protein